ncbi:UPF0390 protein zgc136864-like [Diadema setosum]|uniref:UPF0390 protein zgc136864-like n=1 Tax=Diadema antillarum TaxID=105358 RepID=UPI003A85B14B
MVQGKVRTKVQVPGSGRKNKQRTSHQKKYNQPKKGARYIAPKKARQIQAAKLKKNITKAITARNEMDIISKASSSEPKQLAVVATTSSGDGTAKTQKGKK